MTDNDIIMRTDSEDHIKVIKQVLDIWISDEDIDMDTLEVLLDKRYKLSQLSNIHEASITLMQWCIDVLNNTMTLPSINDDDIELYKIKIHELQDIRRQKETLHN